MAGAEAKVDQAPILALERISASHGQRSIVRDVTMEIHKGEAILLTGPNGCGKSTLLKACLGILPRTAGKLFFGGAEISALPTVARVKMGIGYCPQYNAVFGRLSVRENLILAASNFGKTGNDIDLLGERFAIVHHHRNQKAGTLSGGEQKLLALAMTIIAAPSLLLIDEPFLGLTESNRQIVLEMLQALKFEGKSILLVEHRTSDLSCFIDRAFLMRNGRLKT